MANHDEATDVPEKPKNWRSHCADILLEQVSAYSILFIVEQCESCMEVYTTTAL